MDYPITWNVKEFVGVTVAFLKQFHLKKVLVLGPFLNTKRHTKTGTQAGTPAHGQNHLHAGTWTDSLARRHMDRITHTHTHSLAVFWQWGCRLQVHVVGASLGAFLAQKLAELTKRLRLVQSLVLINGFTDTSAFKSAPSPYL